MSAHDLDLWPLTDPTYVRVAMAEWAELAPRLSPARRAIAFERICNAALRFEIPYLTWSETARPLLDPEAAPRLPALTIALSHGITGSYAAATIPGWGPAQLQLAHRMSAEAIRQIMAASQMFLRPAIERGRADIATVVIIKTSAAATGILAREGLYQAAVVCARDDLGIATHRIVVA